MISTIFWFFTSSFPILPLLYAAIWYVHTNGSGFTSGLKQRTILLSGLELAAATYTGLFFVEFTAIAYNYGWLGLLSVGWIFMLVVFVVGFVFSVAAVTVAYCHVPAQSSIDPKKAGAVLVTGAASGFGKILTESLVKKGVRVFAVDVNEDLLKSEFGNNDLVTCARLDVRDNENCKSIAQLISDSLGEGEYLYGVINSAGVSYAPGSKPVAKSAIELDVDKEIEPVMNINFLGTCRVNHAILPSLLKASKRDVGACIINIASAAGRSDAAFMAAYCASKHSVRTYSMSIRQELILTGIRVKCIEPTFAHTPLAAPAKLPLTEFEQSEIEGVLEGISKKTSPSDMMAWMTAEYVADKVFVELYNAHNNTPHMLVAPFAGGMLVNIMNHVAARWQDRVMLAARYHEVSTQQKAKKDA